mmetsp:Transcript_11991/g.22180  ORF Transcript_11991/g.22180 Transcript_11991/m.22180 type:complete len:205 (-) Transcript_11991:281-895(-)
MSSALQQLYCSDDRLPDAVVDALKEIQEGDERVQVLAKSVAKDRDALFEEMKVATDDTGFEEKINRIADEKRHILDLMVTQQKKAEAAYELVSSIVYNLDKKRTYVYDKIPEHLSMLKKRKVQEVKAATTAQDKKAIKASPRDVIATETVHSDEPIYCVCKKVSFGRMIGCDNDSCPIEWFHFPCVGLDESLPDPEQWFCSSCR